MDNENLNSLLERMEKPLPSTLNALSPRNVHLADWAYEKIMEEISDFESDLDEDHEVGLMLASFGQNLTMHVETLGYQNPNLIYFYGTVNGRDAQLIQHHNQLNFLLTSVPRSPEKPARRIGFRDVEEQE